MKKIIACGSIKPELEKLRTEEDEVSIEFLPQNLHRAPHKMVEHIQKALDNVDEHFEKVILGYGLCSNGIVGLVAPKQGLYIPKTQDCIAFYLGSREKYYEIFSKHPGTYHLTPSWIDNEKDPLGLIENEYTRRVGREMAEETMQYEIRNYEYISFINTGAGDIEKYRKRAKENAAYFDKKFVEYNGTGQYFRKMLEGPYNTRDFIYIEPNCKVTQNEFLK